MFKSLFRTPQSECDYCLFNILFVDGLSEQLANVYVNLTVPALALPAESDTLQTQHRDDDTCVQFGRVFPTSVLRHISDYALVYIGSPECRFLAAVLMAYAGCRCVVYDPDVDETVEVSTAETNKALARRMYLVERARDAQRVGILIGTFTVRPTEF